MSKAMQRRGGDALLFVNFHHVCDDGDLPFPGLHHITPERFDSQIEALCIEFDFPPIAAVETALLESRGLGSPSCVLTFDDGLADHYQHVLPILEQWGIEGVFAINTAPWTDSHMLPVHRAHLLAAAFSYLELAEEIEAAAAQSSISARIRDVSPEVARSQYRYDDADTARIKYFLNSTIAQEKRGAVLARVFAARLGDDRDTARRPYLQPGDCREIVAKGHRIGLHSHRHLNLAAATPEVRVDDLHLNRALLTELAGPPRWISYPYGGPSSYDASVVSLAERVGCAFGLTMNRAFNDATADRMRLSRVDTNDVVGGKHPMDWSELSR